MTAGHVQSFWEKAFEHLRQIKQRIMETRKIDRTGRFVEKHAIEEIKRKMKEFEKDAVKIVGNLDALERTENALHKQKLKVRLAVEHNLEQQRNYRKVKVRNLWCPT